MIALLKTGQSYEYFSKKKLQFEFSFYSTNQGFLNNIYLLALF